MHTNGNVQFDNSRKPIIDDRMFEEFRKIRARVWFEATGKKSENQSKFKEMVAELSDKANLSYWRTNAPEVRSEIWEQVVEKIFYSGFDASKVNARLNSIRGQFGDYKSLCSPDWEVRIKNRRISDDSGPLARAYGADDGLEGKIRHAYKIRKIVRVGRYFNNYFDSNREASALSIILQGNDSEDVWVVSGNLDDIGLSGRLTQLHLLMDLGFDCIKPDIVISRLVLSLGWLAHFAPELPTDLKEADLRGEGKYRVKYHYTNDVVIMPIVNLAREFASRMQQGRKILEEDIGWVSSNPIREFDVFMVSYGQRADPTVGIERQLWSGNSTTVASRGCASMAGKWAGNRVERFTPHARH